MNQAGWDQRRDTFLDRAVAYRRGRPTYPTELLEVAVNMAQLPLGASILEVGCGTGQATRWFAEQGFRITAVDRSIQMVELAGSELSGFEDVIVRCEDFEAITPFPVFDAVLAATSYHWLAPERRAAQCVEHLKPHGSVILLRHTHPPPHRGFFERVQALYESQVPEWDPPPSLEQLKTRAEGIRREFISSGLFASVEKRSWDWSEEYDSHSYLSLLATFSDHASLPPTRRTGLFRAIGELIDREFDGRISRPYRTELFVARRQQSPQEAV